MPNIPALLREIDGSQVLCSPRVGRFRPHVTAGDEVGPETVLGTLTVLKRRFSVTVPAGVLAHIASNCMPTFSAVGYGAVLVTLAEPSGTAPDVGSSPPEAEPDGPIGHVVRSPIDGVFYARSAPDADPYVQEGDRLTPGHMLGLVEVMKTFHPIRYEGEGNREATVLCVEVGDQQEVASGQALVTVELD